jgi:Kef-type K+ transport system membrane component KefB
MTPQKRHWLSYTLLLISFFAAITVVLYYGSSADPAHDMMQGVASISLMASPLSFLRKHIETPFALFLMQVLVIFPVAQVMGALFKKMGQPSVVGQIAAGIILGHSVLGRLSPAAYHFVFPDNSLGTLRLMSQLGILIYMFLIGMEANLKTFQKTAHRTLFISHAGIVVPFVLGCGLAVFLFERYGGPKASFESFAFFLGVSMSITAFPVLARILQEKKLAQSHLGITSLAAAAIGDVTAWILLIFIVAIAESSSGMDVLYTLGFLGVFLFAMVSLVRPFLERKFGSHSEPTENKIAFVLWMLLMCALFTEAIGIHALFGAFVAGAIMPDASKFKEFLSQRLEYFSSVFLLPLFFAVVGVRTEIALLGNPEAWIVFCLLLAVAIAGKLGGTSLAARATGMEWRDALSIGALMNARGLMELIVLNLGYEMGIFSDQIFTKLVMVALVTTIMTGPLLTFFSKKTPT